MNKCAKYLRLRLFCTTVIVRTHTRTHTQTHTTDRLHYTAAKAVGNKKTSDHRNIEICIAGGADYHGENVMWHGPVNSIAVVCSSSAVMPLLRITIIITFAAYTAADTPNTFQWVGQTATIVPSRGRSQPHRIRGSWGPCESAIFSLFQLVDW